MAISVVGTVQAGGAPSANDVTLTFDGSPVEGDYAVVLGCIADNGSGNLATPTGYTALITQDTASENHSGGLYFKKMGVTPDSSVTFAGGGDAGSATAACSIMLRGVDGSTFSDATPVKTGPTTSADPDLDAITTVTDGAWVFALVVGNQNDAARTAPSGYTDDAFAFQTDTRRANASMSHILVASAGPENPGAYTSWTSEQWTGFTVAVRPAGAQTLITGRSVHYDFSTHTLTILSGR